MALKFIGPITLKTFQRTDLNYQKAGCWEGTLLAVQKYSSDLMEIPFQLKEFKEKQAEFYSKYFFNEQGKSAFATGSITFKNGNILLMIEELDFQGFKTQGVKIVPLNGVQQNSEETVSKPVSTYTPKEETVMNNSFAKAKEQQAELNTNQNNYFQQQQQQTNIVEQKIEQAQVVEQNGANNFKASSAMDFWKNSGIKNGN